MNSSKFAACLYRPSIRGFASKNEPPKPPSLDEISKAFHDLKTKWTKWEHHMKDRLKKDEKELKDYFLKNKEDAKKVVKKEAKTAVDKTLK
jgi:hypothetical protein